MDFSAALTAAKAGKTIARGTEAEPHTKVRYVTSDEYSSVNWQSAEAYVPWNASLISDTAMGGVVTGGWVLWSPSMADVLADDWHEVTEA